MKLADELTFSFPCMPFSGLAGELLVLSLSVLSVAVIIAAYYYRLKVTKTELRMPRLFAYDISKNLLAQSSAWVVNLVMTSLVAASAARTLRSALLERPQVDRDTFLAFHSHPFVRERVSEADVRRAVAHSHIVEGVGIYFAIFLFDCLVGVPLGIVLGRGINALCAAGERRLAARRRQRAWLTTHGQRLQARRERLASMVGSVPRIGGGGSRSISPAPSEASADARARSPSLLLRSEPSVGGPGGQNNNKNSSGSGGGGGEGAGCCCSTLLCAEESVYHFCQQNAVYGRYVPTRARDAANDGDDDDDDGSAVDEAELLHADDRWGPRLRLSWWWSQLFTWSLAVIVSRAVSGLLLLALFELVEPRYNLALALAAGISELPWSCAVKQWLVCGVFRVVIDALQIVVIDFANKMRLRRSAAANSSGSSSIGAGVVTYGTLR